MNIFDKLVTNPWFTIVCSNISQRLSVLNPYYLGNKANPPFTVIDNKLGDSYEGYRTLTKEGTEEEPICKGLYGGHGSLMYFGKESKYGRLGRGSYNFSGESVEPYFSDDVMKYFVTKIKYSDLVLYPEYDNYIKFFVNTANSCIIYNGTTLGIYNYYNEPVLIDVYIFKPSLFNELKKEVYIEDFSSNIKIIEKKLKLLNDDDKLFNLVLRTNTRNNLREFNIPFRMGELLDGEEQYDFKYGYVLATDPTNTERVKEYELYTPGLILNKLLSGFLIDNQVYIEYDKNYNYIGDNYKLENNNNSNNCQTYVFYKNPLEYLNKREPYILISFIIKDGQYIKKIKGSIVGINKCSEFFNYFDYSKVGYHQDGRWVVDTRREVYRLGNDIDLQDINNKIINFDNTKYNDILRMCNEIQEVDCIDLNQLKVFKEYTDLYLGDLNLVDTDFKILGTDNNIRYTRTYMSPETYDYLDETGYIQKGRYFNFEDDKGVYINSTYVYNSRVNLDNGINYETDGGFYCETLDPYFVSNEKENTWFFKEEPALSFPSLPGPFYYEEVNISSGVITKSILDYYEELLQKKYSNQTESGKPEIEVPEIDVSQGITTENKKEEIDNINKDTENKKEEIENIKQDSSLTDEEKQEEISKIEEEINNNNNKIEEIEEELKNDENMSSGGSNINADVDVDLTIDEDKLGDYEFPKDEDGNDYIDVTVEVEVTDENGNKYKVLQTIQIKNPLGINSNGLFSFDLGSLVKGLNIVKLNFKLVLEDDRLLDAVKTDVSITLTDKNNALDKAGLINNTLTLNGIIHKGEFIDNFTIIKTRSKKTEKSIIDLLTSVDNYVILKTRSKKRTVKFNDSINANDNIKVIREV